ncbi:hypothetical protein [Saccharopolyspora phatthalungensis]|uniref:Uncharacterized protein n=1 Tax=Saccharopolyspora phatthalungensis TaxID=664693 RepID=A0A840Q649_9PSEU|nr:hypothetical protein [Saccharopolyspora phatthalungensis]MBB5156104.1 hypothetical protein [Saccharopolyspora phatthalungensis]
MRPGQHETILLDRPPCGLDEQEWLRCNQQLPRFLPPVAVLNVVTRDGTTYSYEGIRDAD